MTPEEAARVLERYLRTIPRKDIPLEVYEAFLALLKAAGLGEHIDGRSDA